MAARDEEEEEIPEVEADGFQKGDRKGDEEKKALCLLNYDVSHVNIARVPRECTTQIFGWANEACRLCCCAAKIDILRKTSEESLGTSSAQ
ncbi:uncharacterized protein [Oscarella lobularis]|uniref:uncharacterized protein isoform X2 n=1 Tax=Oscarella lobularis TaxID=121494 RepID=UPI0033133CA6